MTDLLVFLSLISPPDMTGPVAVHAAYVIHTQDFDDPSKKCCGACNGTGFVTHGDGHKTPCPCPPDCECKTVKHPPALLKQDCKECTPTKS